ncbi:MAG: ABC transporter ATP-binding protein, partial [Sphaerochaetaceae bacterium]|nr:ABC transporter ATP-binding protein [Sphaerochaetaceae bacterium]
DFKVDNGEFFTLLGPSGCGKTTTLRAVSGFEKISKGEILLDGKNIAPLSPEEREIGFVFQNYALFPSMTVFNNIGFGLKIRHISKDKIRKRVEDVAELTGILEHLPKKVSELSGGQQQRVAIARALILNPRLLLMDEPLSNLDAKLRVSMRGEIKRIQKKLGIVAIYVTHDQEEAMAVSDKIAVFNQGVIEQIGTPKEIYNNPKTEFVCKFIGAINEFDEKIIESINKENNIDLSGKYFIRPENVHLVKKEEEKGIYLSGKIIDIEFLGAFSKSQIEVGNSSIISLEIGEKNYPQNSEVKVFFKETDLLKF